MGTSGKSTDFGDMLESAIDQILLQPIRWDPVFATLRTRMQILGSNIPLRVVPVATAVDQMIYSTLQQQSPLLSMPGRTLKSNSPGATTSEMSDSTPNGDKIAIIGMAGRFPEAATTHSLWDILRLGLDVSKEVPPLRWNLKTHVDPSGRKKNSSRTSLGCWLNDPDVFDANFFGISVQEATCMDPAQRLALMTTYEAMEQAGIVWPSGVNNTGATPSTRPDRVGVYFGVSGNDWRDCNAAQKIDSHYMRASSRAFISARISEVFKVRGPSLAVDTSSSNSMAPVHIACRSLWARETDTCIVGGAHVMTNPDVHAGLDRAGLLSRSGNCKVFDETADGFCRGEGVVSLVLKRLGDAVAENDTILGVMSGVATNYDLELPGPDSDSARYTSRKSLFTKVLNNSNVDPASISYVEMCGSSTNIDDASQVASAVEVLAPRSASGRLGKRSATPLYLGSVMANIGCGEATSGLSGIFKVLLMLRENEIPPHIGMITQVNSKFPVDLPKTRNTHIHTGKPIKWDNGSEPTSGREPRRALIYDQGTIAQTTSALLLEDKPLRDQDQYSSSAALCPLDTDPLTSYIVAISAKSRVSLRRNLANLYFWLNNETARNQYTLVQLSYTTTARRHHHTYRTMLLASSFEDLCARLAAELQQSRLPQMSAPSDMGSLPLASTFQAEMARPVVFAFTDSITCNSSSCSSFAYFRQLYKIFSYVRQNLHDLEHIVRRLGLPSVLNAIGLETDGDPHQHSEAQQSSDGIRKHLTAKQLAHICTQIVLSRLWRSWGINPIAVVSNCGVDIYSALNAAGVLSDADTIYLAGASIQLAMLQQTEKGHLGHEEYWDAASTTEFKRLDSLIAYQKAQFPVLTLMTTEASHDIPCQGKLSSKPRLDVFARVGGGNQMLLTRRFMLNIKPMDLIGKAAHVPTKRDLLSACRTSDVIPEQSITQEMGPTAPLFYVTTTEEINIDFLSDVHTCHQTGDRNATEDTSRLQMWPRLTETLRAFYCAGVNIRWDQYHLDLPLRSRRVISTLPPYGWDLKEYWVPYVNDWTLLKGDASKAIVAPKLESTTIHTIIEETEFMEEDGNKLRLVVEADISRNDLHGIVQGHVVDGVPLCTPVCDLQQLHCERLVSRRHQLTSLLIFQSVYSDVALSLGKYMQQRYRHGCPERLINIKDMAVTKALIAQPSGPQKLRAHVEADWDSNSATCKFTTCDVSRDQVVSGSCPPPPHGSSVVSWPEDINDGTLTSCSVATSHNNMPSAQSYSVAPNSYCMLSSLTWLVPTVNWSEPLGRVSQPSGPFASRAT